MYSKDELLSKNISELEDIAKELGTKFDTGASQEDVVYAILDKQAEVEGNKNPLKSILILILKPLKRMTI